MDKKEIDMKIGLESLPTGTKLATKVKLLRRIR